MKVTVCETVLKKILQLSIDNFSVCVCARVYIMLSCNRCCIVAIYDGQGKILKNPCREDVILCTAMISCAVQNIF